MALITNAATSWSSPITLTDDEVWQTRAGSIFLTTSTSPATDDGIALDERHAIQFSAGQTVRYRKVGLTDALIVRETV